MPSEAASPSSKKMTLPAQRGIAALLAAARTTPDVEPLAAFFMRAGRRLRGSVRPEHPVWTLGIEVHRYLDRH
jgi:hypothetical protein